MEAIEKIKKIFFSDKDFALSEQKGKDNLLTTILCEIGRAMSSSMVDKEKTHHLIVEAVTMTLQVQRSIIMLRDDEGDNLVAKAVSGMVSDDFIDDFRVKIGEGLVGSVAKMGETKLVCKLAGEDEVVQNVADKLHVDSLLVAPLKVEGKVLGVITADTKHSGEQFSDKDIKLLSALADLAAVAEENASLIEMLRDKAQRLSVLFDIGQALNSTLKLQELLDLIVEKAIDVTRASSGSIMLCDKGDNSLIIRSTKGLSADVMREVRLKIGEGVTGWVAENGRALIISDVTKDERYKSVNDKVRSELAVPMLRKGEVIGVINVDHYDLDAFTCWDMETLSTLASAAIVALKNAELFEDLERYRCSEGDK